MLLCCDEKDGPVGREPLLCCDSLRGCGPGSGDGSRRKHLEKLVGARGEGGVQQKTARGVTGDGAISHGAWASPNGPPKWSQGQAGVHNPTQMAPLVP